MTTPLSNVSTNTIPTRTNHHRKAAGQPAQAPGATKTRKGTPPPTKRTTGSRRAALTITPPINHEAEASPSAKPATDPTESTAAFASIQSRARVLALDLAAAAKARPDVLSQHRSSIRRASEGLLESICGLGEVVDNEHARACLIPWPD